MNIDMKFVSCDQNVEGRDRIHGTTQSRADIVGRLGVVGTFFTNIKIVFLDVQYLAVIPKSIHVII